MGRYSRAAPGLRAVAPLHQREGSLAEIAFRVASTTTRKAISAQAGRS